MIFITASKPKSGQSIVGSLVALFILGLAGAAMWSTMSARFKGAKKDQVQAAMVALSQQVLSSLYNPDAYAFLDKNYGPQHPNGNGNFQVYILNNTITVNRTKFYEGFTRYFVPMIPNPPPPGAPSRRDISCPTPPQGFNPNIYDNQLCFGRGQTTTFTNQRLDQVPAGCPAATCYDSAAFSNLFYTLEGNSCTRTEFQNANNKVCALRVDFRVGAFLNTANNFRNLQESDGARAWYLYAHYRISAKNLGPNMPAPIEVRNEALPGALVRSITSSSKCNRTNHLGIRAINPVTGETRCWNRPPAAEGLSCANNPDFAAPNADERRVFAVGLEVAPIAGTVDEPSDTLRLRCVVATRVTCPAGYALQSFRVSKLRSDTLSDGDDDPARANEDRCVLIGEDSVPLKNGNCTPPYVGDFTTVPPRCVAPATGNTVSPNLEIEADQ